MESTNQFGGEISTLYDNGIEIRHVIPYFMGVWTPNAAQAKNGSKPLIFYVSSSENNGFKDEKGQMIPFTSVRYQDLDTLYLEMERKNGYREAFRYLLNIQSVCHRVLSDCRELYKSNNETTTYLTKEQYAYVHEQMRTMVESLRMTLKFYKDLMLEEGQDVNFLTTMTTDKSHTSQKFRIARAIRILKELKVL